MKEILLCKLGEIVLKGANRRYFEDTLCRNLRHRAKHFGTFEVKSSQSTITITPQDDFCDIDGLFQNIQTVFGIVAISRCAVCEKSMEAIEGIIKSYIPQFLVGKKTFKVVAKRSDKKFVLDSMEIAREVGGYVLSTVRGIKVDVNTGEVIDDEFDFDIEIVAKLYDIFGSDMEGC